MAHKQKKNDLIIELYKLKLKTGKQIIILG